ncbi:PIG-L family deacetylase [Alienimonas chondri]|uniref:1D-myo-inositol 2-acetamido-2-deoxy-alpha-D-glucopyranoside deacetylase n=1 Tax=Alienimonas chondri TaxID=2681879 RepID=A0ABX1VBC8_9PLAN|nr:1D-myo-inositol 2-acetamido-2-deoxy-alpha-D-glucopyranoside deacetylase [Alienimonas chondri]
MVDLPAPLDVIAVGAHPDDVEIGCGGTLARLVEQGYRVGLVDLTDGEPTPCSSGPEERMAEAKAAAEALGLHYRHTLDLPNRRLFDSFEARCELAKIFRKYRPKVVLGIAAKTPMASPDHWQATQITDAAVFYSRLCKWDEHFTDPELGPLPVHRIDKQVWYPLGFSTSALPPNGGSFVADISSTYDKKLAAVKCYASQFPPEKKRVWDILEGASLYHGSSAGFERGELFLSATTVGTRDFLQTVLPPVDPVAAP